MVGAVNYVQAPPHPSIHLLLTVPIILLLLFSLIVLLLSALMLFSHFCVCVSSKVPLRQLGRVSANHSDNRAYSMVSVHL